MGVACFDFDYISSHLIDYYFSSSSLEAVPAMMVRTGAGKRIIKFGEGLGWKKPIDRAESKRRLNLLGNQATALLVKTGPSFGLIVLDIDRKNGNDGFAYLEKKGHLLPSETPIVVTPHNGKHFWLRFPVGLGIPIRPGWLFEKNSGVEILTDSVVPAPPSFVLNHGGRYRWEKPVGACPLAECPEWLLEAIQALKPEYPAKADFLLSQPLSFKTMRDLSPFQQRKINYWFNLALNSEHPNNDEFSLALCCVRFELDDHSISEMLLQCPKGRKRGMRYINTTIINARIKIASS